MRGLGGGGPYAGLGRHQTIIDPGIMPPLKRCAASVPGYCVRFPSLVEQRSLAIYDAVLGTGADDETA